MLKTMVIFISIILGANSALHAADFLGANVEDCEVQEFVWRSRIKRVKPIVSDAPNGSVAAQAGLQKGDVIIMVGKSLAGRSQYLVNLIKSANDLTVLRGLERITLPLSSSPTVAFSAPTTAASPLDNSKSNVTPAVFVRRSLSSEFKSLVYMPDGKATVDVEGVYKNFGIINTFFVTSDGKDHFVSGGKKIAGDLYWRPAKSETTPVASISIGSEYSIGNYNSNSTTRFIYTPLIISWYPGVRLDFSVELPYIYQSITSPASIQNSNSPVTSSNVTTDTSISESSGNKFAVSGFGDIILRGGYILSFEKGFMPQVRGSLLLKTPTASVSEGLGTGKCDFGGGLDLSKWFGNLHLGGDAIYTYQGKMTDAGLKNYVSYSATVGYQITDNIHPMLIIKGATAPSVYYDEIVEARGRVLWTLTSATYLDLFASRGISNNSPDYGSGISVIYSY
ncbi:MAG TPA: hypothetical protein HPP97_09680 [Desulfuromonadales bacterium]|nr:hypothetical protein [Desulfuromonadales bacterium]